MTEAKEGRGMAGTGLKTSSIQFTRHVVVGTRGSALAQWQTQHVIGLLKQLAPEVEFDVKIVKTSGDKDQTRALADFGGLGVFTKEIENALLSRDIDIAVHSLKDLPTEMTAGLSLGAVPVREDARDVLVSRHDVGLDALPAGARIGTSSARRKAQVLALRPDVEIVPLRGNVDTRLKKAATGDYDAIILAAAGITRLGRASEITEYLPLDKVLPDPGQGALGIQIRADDGALAALLAPLNHAPTRAAVLAERAFLQALGGGCRMPIGAFGELAEGELRLRGVVGSLDGRTMVVGEILGLPEEAERLGSELAAELVARGAGEILGTQGVGQAGSPLAGKRIIVTRAQEQAKELSDRIRLAGGQPIEFPTIGFAPLQDFSELDAALDGVATYDWVVFTSANGVRAVAERLESRGREIGGIKQSGLPKIAAIGPATARALETLGLTVDFIPTKYLGEQIAAELPARPGQKALLLRADIASDQLRNGLEARGVQANDIDAYRTVLPPAPQGSLEADAITFTSSSTVRNFVAIVGERSRDLLREMRVFCIGPVTAETARELGLRVDAVAGEHTVDGLVKTIVDFYTSAEK